MAERLGGVPWWSAEARGDAHLRLLPLVRGMQRTQSTRYLNMRRMRAIYEGGFGASTSTSGLDLINESRLHFNVARNAIDTMHAQVCTPRVSPMLLTEGASYSQRERAKTATKAVEGVLDEASFEEVQEDVTLDAMLGYCGFAHVYSDVEVVDDDADEKRYVGRLRIERVPPEDIYVDEAEGRYRAPRCLYRVQLVDRYVLLAAYGETDPELHGTAAQRRRAIERARGGAQRADEPLEQQTDMIEVWEAWHLPSGPVRYTRDGKPRTDGRHTIAIDGATLVDEPWTRRGFPIIVYRPEKARSGFWGLAAMQQAMAGQREYERVTEKLQRAHKLLGGAHFVASRAAKVNVRELTNGVGRVIEPEGDISQVREWTPAPANPQTYQYRESIAADILRYLGVSSYAAQSEVPAGLSQASGKALHAFEDQENKRQILRHRARERFVVEVAEAVIEEALSLVERGVRVVSRHAGKRGFDAVDWKDLVDVLRDKESFVVRTFPVSMLMQTPAAKWQQLDILLERGAITIEQFKRLFGMPDIESETDVDCADYEVIDKNLDHMVMTGRYVSPQPFDNLEMIKVRAGKSYNAYRIAEVPDERLELVRRYIADAQALIDAAAPPAPAPMATGPAPMMAPPDAGLDPAMVAAAQQQLVA